MASSFHSFQYILLFSDENGKPETRLQATLSFDQAAISDDTAAFFMKVLAQVLENPNFLLLDAFNDGRKSVESFI